MQRIISEKLIVNIVNWNKYKLKRLKVKKFYQNNRKFKLDKLHKLFINELDKALIIVDVFNVTIYFNIWKVIIASS